MSEITINVHVSEMATQKEIGDALLEALSRGYAAGKAYLGHDFGGALAALRKGKRVTRRGWNGKGMYIELQRPDAHSKMTLPYIFMKTADGNLVPWLASQTDLLSEDWTVVE
jgi:hypothetical protein